MEEKKSDLIPETPEGKIEYAEKLKEEGNVFFKKGEYKKALRKYKLIYLYVAGLKPSLSKIMGVPNEKNQENEMEANIRKLKLASKLNSALCYIKLGEGRKAREYANKVLLKDKDNAKAIFRRGQGWMVDGFIENAKKDFQTVLEKHPDDVGVKRAFLDLRKRKNEVNKKEKKMYKNIRFE